MSQHVISIREIIAIALTMAKRTDFVDRPALVGGPDTKGCDIEYQRSSFAAQNMHHMPQSNRPMCEVSSFIHGKRYHNDLSYADKCW